MSCVGTGAARSDHIRCGARYTLILFVAGALSACGVTRNEFEAAAVFGKSASALADGATSAYAQAVQDEADLRTARFTVLNARQNFDTTPILQKDYEKPLISLSKADIPGRYAAAAALTAYGKALTTLLDVKTQEGDLASATDKFTEALKGIPSQTLNRARIKPSDIDDFGKLITAFGDLYLDYRRRETLELIVPNAEPIVTKLCLLFARDFNPDGGLFATILFNDLEDVIAFTNASLGDSAKESTKDDNDKPEVARKKQRDGLHDRAILLPIYQRVSAIQTKVRFSYKTITEAAKSCSKANIALAQAVQDPTVTLDDILDFANKAEAAYNAIAAGAGQK